MSNPEKCGHTEDIHLRLDAGLLADIDRYRVAQEVVSSRPRAVRHLLRLALVGERPKAGAFDSLGDLTVRDELTVLLALREKFDADVRAGRYSTEQLAAISAGVGAIKEVARQSASLPGAAADA